MKNFVVSCAKTNDYEKQCSRFQRFYDCAPFNPKSYNRCVCVCVHISFLFSFLFFNNSMIHFFLYFKQFVPFLFLLFHFHDWTSGICLRKVLFMFSLSWRKKGGAILSIVTSIQFLLLSFVRFRIKTNYFANPLENAISIIYKVFIALMAESR